MKKEMTIETFLMQFGVAGIAIYLLWQIYKDNREMIKNDLQTIKEEMQEMKADLREIKELLKFILMKKEKANML